MKYGNTYYIELPREIFEKREKKLSTSAKWLFCVLNELEHRFADESGMFFRSNDDLAHDAEMSLATVKSAKRELIEAGLITTGTLHWKDPKTNKLSKKHVTSYRIKV